MPQIHSFNLRLNCATLLVEAHKYINAPHILTLRIRYYSAGVLRVCLVTFLNLSCGNSIYADPLAEQHHLVCGNISRSADAQTIIVPRRRWCGACERTRTCGVSYSRRCAR